MPAPTPPGEAQGFPFLGNKAALADWICEQVTGSLAETTSPQPAQPRLADLFVGCGCVARKFAEAGWEVQANDISTWNSLVARAFLCHPSGAPIEAIASALNAEVDAAETLVPGFFTTHYTPVSTPPRMFFTEKNGLRLDAYLARLNAGQLDAQTKDVLTAALIQNTLHNINAAGHTRAFFKQWLAKSRRPITIDPSRLGAHSLGAATPDDVTCLPAEDAIGAAAIACDVVYCDPPYSGTRLPYYKFYNVCESIALNEQDPNAIATASVAGSRNHKPRGAATWSGKTRAPAAITHLAKVAAAARVALEGRCRILALSWSSDASPDESGVVAALLEGAREGGAAAPRVEVRRRAHTRYRSRSDTQIAEVGEVPAGGVQELLFLLFI